MVDEYYPWGGEFVPCNPKSNVAVVILDIDYTPTNRVAIYGPLKTENIGIEKIVANVISNPHIRYLIVCGKEICGHRAGASLIALSKNGIDENNRIIGAPGAIPYIENLDREAIDRFRSQIEVIGLIDVTDKEKIDRLIDQYLCKKTEPFGEPYIAIRIIPEREIIEDKRALHSKIVINYMGKIKRRGD